MSMSEEQFDKLTRMILEEQTPGHDDRLAEANERAERWRQQATQGFTPEKAWQWIGALLGIALFLVVFGQMGLWLIDRTTERSAGAPVAAPMSTSTPLQREVEAALGWQGTDWANEFQTILVADTAGLNLMQQHGTWVVTPVTDGDGYISCPPAFPIVATSYGAYYTRSDELFFNVQASRWLTLCFSSEETATAAGYIHAPMKSP